MGHPDITPEEGDVFEECNFGQPHANVALFNGIKNLTFIACNTINCVMHPTTKYKRNQTGKQDFCVHMKPDVGLPQEVDNCRHVVSVDDSDPENIVYERRSIPLGKRVDVQLTDEETRVILEPYNDIRKKRNGKPEWVTNG